MGRKPTETHGLPHGFFALRSISHSTWLSAHGQHKELVYQSQSKEHGEWERWCAIEIADRIYALRSFHGTFLALGEDNCLVQEASLLKASHFVVFPSSDGSVAFFCDEGCISVKDSASADPELVHTTIGSHSRFEILTCEMP